MRWNYKIDIKEDWKKANDNPTKENNMMLIKSICVELERILFVEKNTGDIDNLMFEFEDLLNLLECDSFDTVEEFQKEFNYVMTNLYDWGDTSFYFGYKMCWINTH